MVLYHMLSLPTIILFALATNSVEVPEACEQSKKDGIKPSITFYKDDGVVSTCGEAIVDIPQAGWGEPPTRPTPDQYFNEDDILEHLHKFDDGAAYVVKNYVLEHYNYGTCEQSISYCTETDWVGFETGQFVSTLQTYKEMLSSVNIAEDGVAEFKRIFDETLGFPEADSMVNPSTTPDSQTDSLAIILIVIDGEIIQTKIGDGEMRMASGNEAGANPRWEPGGYLPTGKPEAVMDKIPKPKQDPNDKVHFYKIFEWDEEGVGKFISNNYNDIIQHEYIPRSCYNNPNDSQPPSAKFHETECGQYIKSLKNGDRPDPRTYFSRDHYKHHLQLFADKGAAYIVKRVWLEHYNYGKCNKFHLLNPSFCRSTPNIGLPTGQFVSTLRTYQNMLSKIDPSADGVDQYQKIFDSGLGFAFNESFLYPSNNPGNIISNVDIILIVIDAGLVRHLISNGRMTMASGNEYNANTKWIPGGYLPTGYPEAVLDNVPKDRVKKYIIFRHRRFVSRNYNTLPFEPDLQSSPQSDDDCFVKTRKIAGRRGAVASAAQTGKTATSARNANRGGAKGFQNKKQRRDCQNILEGLLPPG